ncbi:endolytic transglycosylase MltG [Streptomyces sp. C36]|uniref:endolytic transglycosylase MltG n=1 Tax=Streptomyces sp. C36 TaxID=3237122 RepID=UPI0034C6C382
MTEYGRGSGSQPWHPEDPLYGDQGYGGQQYAQHQPQSQPTYEQPYPDQQQQYGWDPSQNAGGPGDPYAGHGGTYGGGGQPDHYQYDTGTNPYPPQHQAPYAGDQHTGQHPVQQQTGQHPIQQHTGQHPIQQHTGQHPIQQHTGQHPIQQQTGQHPIQQHTGQHPIQQHTGQHPIQQQTGQHPIQQQTGQHPIQQHTGQHPIQQHTGQHPVQQQTGQHPIQQAQVPAEASAEVVEQKISLFDDPLPPAPAPARDEDEYEDDDPEPRDEPRRGRGGRGKGKSKEKAPKRRSGTACLLVAVVLVGVVGGGGYLAYDYWQTHYGSAPDYDGEGSGQVTVEIPKGSSLTQMGQILEKAGVVKSVGAFTSAAAKKSIQPGTYTLRKEMSGAAAVGMMTDSGNFLTLHEGIRAVNVYAAIDKKLGLASGTTKGVAASQAKNLGLPDWANSDPKIRDPLEGFLYPSQYSAGKGTKPEDVLRQMVARAKENYAKQDLEGKAKELGLKSPLQLITVASLVNAEGMTHDDFRKMSRVIYNRLKPTNVQTNGKLEFDSTANYAKNQSKLDLNPQELRKYDHPYNTYFIRGLPPGPIGNPGAEALRAAMDPEPGDWYYFVSINEKTTFTKNLQEHQKLVDEFNKSRKTS